MNFQDSDTIATDKGVSSLVHIQVFCVIIKGKKIKMNEASIVRDDLK